MKAEDTITEQQVLAITTAYEQGVGKGRQFMYTNRVVENPYASAWKCDYAWQLGFNEGAKQVATEEMK